MRTHKCTAASNRWCAENILLQSRGHNIRHASCGNNMGKLCAALMDYVNGDFENEEGMRAVIYKRLATTSLGKAKNAADACGVLEQVGLPCSGSSGGAAGEATLPDGTIVTVGINATPALPPQKKFDWADAFSGKFDIAGVQVPKVAVYAGALVGGLVLAKVARR